MKNKILELFKILGFLPIKLKDDYYKLKIHKPYLDTNIINIIFTDKLIIICMNNDKTDSFYHIDYIDILENELRKKKIDNIINKRKL